MAESACSDQAEGGAWAQIRMLWRIDSQVQCVDAGGIG